MEHRFSDKRVNNSNADRQVDGLEAVHSDYHIADLRHLYDRTESSIRALDVLGVKAEFYGALLTPIFIKRIPSDLRLHITRKVPAANWNLQQILKVCLEEIEVRQEREPHRLVRVDSTPSLDGRKTTLPQILSLVVGRVVVSIVNSMGMARLSVRGGLNR